MAKYIVTGAAGFIGSFVSKALIVRGDEVLGVDNLNDDYDVRLKDFRLKELEALKGFELARIDMVDKAKVDALAEKGPFAAVINLAARAGVRASLKDPLGYLATNTQGTLNWLEFCKDNKIKKFVLASTSSIYGEEAPLPTPETADSSKPLQPYSASKKGAEVMAHAYHYLYGLDVSVVRFFTVFGPAGRPNMSIFRFIKWIHEEMPLQLFGDGSQTRGFTYVDDISTGVLLALKEVGYEIFNLGGHQNISISGLIEMIEEIVGKKAVINELPAVTADMFASLADVTKAREQLGWEPKVSLQEGVQKVADWYFDHYEWAKDISTD
jgi:nucleoside-diphosphate-sugar epimerase